MEARFSALVQTGPGAHTAPCTGSFPRAKSGRSVTLTPHGLLVPWSRKSRAITLLPVWVIRPVPVQGCTLPLPLHKSIMKLINRLTPNDPYMGRTAPLSSKLFILYIYSTNTGTEYFKHALYSPFFLFEMQFVS